jgi:hypothetical protein
MEKALLPPLCCLFRRVFLVKSLLKSAELLLLLEPWYLSERMDSVMPPWAEPLILPPVAVRRTASRSQT